MPKGTNQKLKLYRLAQIMLENTDDEHYITMPEIMEELGKYEVTADRKTIYGEFVEMIYKVQGNIKSEGSYTEKMMMDDLSKFSKQITLWGSSRVVNKWVKFREEGANPNAKSDNLFLMEDIMNEMRKDLGMKKVKKGNLLAFFVNDIKSILKK